MLHLTLLRVATDLPMENFSLDIRVMKQGGDGGVEGNGRVGGGGTAGDGDATRHGGAVGDRPHAGAHSFYCIGYVHFIYVVALFDEIWTTPIISIGWSRGASGRVLAPDIRALVASFFLPQSLKQPDIHFTTCPSWTCNS